MILPNATTLRLAIGLLCALALALALLVHDRNRWKSIASLRHQQVVAEKAAHLATVANYRAAAAQARARPTSPTPRGCGVNRRGSIKGAKMISKAVLPLLALMLAACSSRQQAPQPIPAVAEQRQCPPYPLPPARLIKPPMKTDFLRQMR